MVVLDLTIAVVALPHIRAALGFSGSNLEWVVNAYAVAFGGLLLLGGRAGDLQGRRRILIAGLLVFSLASLLGGLATGQAWLIAARAVQAWARRWPRPPRCRWSPSRSRRAGRGPARSRCTRRWPSWASWPG
jgi:sugar phosphate permease